MFNSETSLLHIHSIGQSILHTIRRPMLTWPRQLPIGGEPSNVVAIVDAYAAWLSTSAIPKLYIRAEPGTHSEKMIEQVRTWPNQQEVIVRGIKYPPRRFT
jgi:haloalkane dehalogenase